jgi:hypothetical protein
MVSRMHGTDTDGQITLERICSRSSGGHPRRCAHASASDSAGWPVAGRGGGHADAGVSCTIMGGIEEKAAPWYAEEKSARYSV